MPGQSGKKKEHVARPSPVLLNLTLAPSIPIVKI
jgi:hypothetical protein